LDFAIRGEPRRGQERDLWHSNAADLREIDDHQVIRRSTIDLVLGEPSATFIPGMTGVPGFQNLTTARLQACGAAGGIPEAQRAQNRPALTAR
jgi:hypothetical protein